MLVVHIQTPHDKMKATPARSRILVVLNIFICVTWSQSDEWWSPWSDWSECTRSCGGGVSSRERTCVSFGLDESVCEGESKEYRSCNIQDCPDGSLDFRTEQCSDFNDDKHNWVPYDRQAPTGVCELNCMPKGYHFYRRLKEKVVDGTRCYPDSYDICVDGLCQHVGCDFILGSNAEDDKCRVCNGGGRNCLTKKGNYKPVGVTRYKRFLVIPRGATNIRIEELSPSSNFIALLNVDGDNIINGNYYIETSNKRDVFGSLLRYTRSYDKEDMTILGPINQPVIVAVLVLNRQYKPTDPGINWEYSVPSDTQIKDMEDFMKYKWVASDYKDCSASCAGGVQYRNVKCVHEPGNENVKDYFCNASTRPKDKKECNIQPCPASWYISRWSPCSTSCGPGMQVRRVHCTEIVDRGETAMLNDSECAGEKPKNMQGCTLIEQCPEWKIGEWTQCSSSCGDGLRTRAVKCSVQSSNAIPGVTHCGGKQPEDSEPCNLGPCSVDWKTSDWSECSPKCGKGMRSRQVYCEGVDQRRYSDSLCNNETRPDDMIDCPNQAECPPMWHASQWSKCTAECGKGVETRNVYCLAREGTHFRILTEESCDVKYKMATMRHCIVKACSSHWFASNWKQCSRSCGGGVRTRSVKCFADLVEDFSGILCDVAARPITEETCNNSPCSSQELGQQSPRQPDIGAIIIKRPKPETAAPATEEPTSSIHSLPSTGQSTSFLIDPSITTNIPLTDQDVVIDEILSTLPSEQTTTEQSLLPTTVGTDTEALTTENTTERETTVADGQTTVPSTAEETIDTTTSISITPEDVTSPTPSAIEVASEVTTPEVSITEKETEVTTSQTSDTEETSEVTTTEASITEELSEVTTPNEFITEERNEVTTPEASITEELKEVTTPEASITEELNEVTTPDSSITEKLNEVTTPEASIPEKETEVTTSQLSATEEASKVTTPEASITEELSEVTTPDASITEELSVVTGVTTAKSSTIEEKSGVITEKPPTTEEESDVTTSQPSTSQVTTSSEYATESTTPDIFDFFRETTTEDYNSATTTEDPRIKKWTVRIVKGPQNLLVRKGQNAVMECLAEGDPLPHIYWRKGRMRVEILGSRFRVDDRRGTLLIKDVRKEDSAQYVCVATNYLSPSAYQDATLSVIDAPSAYISEPQTVTEGSRVVINCDVDGTPRPTTLWRKDLKVLLLQNTRKYSVTPSQVVIHNVQVSDAGTYSCTAVNKYGTKVVETELYVDGLDITVSPVTTIPDTTVVKRGPCRDSNTLASCSLGKQNGYCNHPFFKQACCRTCSGKKKDTIIDEPEVR